MRTDRTPSWVPAARQMRADGATLREIAAVVGTSNQMVLYHMPPPVSEIGYCECGCGQQAPIAKMTRRSLGHVRGKPVRFVSGHARFRGTEARFWEKVDKDGPIPAFAPHLGNCWVWTAGTGMGYGVFYDGAGAKAGAHRWLYQQINGPIDHGLEIDHLCRVRRCVRPDHLEVVTPATNAHRSPLRTPHGRRIGEHAHWVKRKAEIAAERKEAA